ncbi:hypothetical protein [Enterovibrio norvegicus]|uniref:hypothetical protein n=1 Tax=Enterovibrio norvegicus TaxID=188144 RepID=UPI0039B0327B
MKNWEEDDNEEYCTAAEDLADAQAVCDKCVLHLHTINFAHEVLGQCIRVLPCKRYKAGRTPNPDILCKKEIKFKAFLEFADEVLDADYIAMGHYVRRTFPTQEELDVGVKPEMLRGLDSNKDQSYFLYTLSSDQVARSLFPVGRIREA